MPCMSSHKHKIETHWNRHWEKGESLPTAPRLTRFSAGVSLRREGNGGRGLYKAPPGSQNPGGGRGEGERASVPLWLDPRAAKQQSFQTLPGGL